jgi:putative permease
MKISVNSRKIFFIILLLVLTIALLKFIPRLFFPFFIAYFIFMIVNPMILFIQRSSNRTRIKWIVITSIIFSIFAYLIINSFMSLQDESTNFQEAYARVEFFLRDKYFYLKTFLKEKFKFDLNTTIVDKSVILLQDIAQAIFENVPVYLSYFLEWMFLVPIYLYFLIKDGFEIKKFLVSLVPNSISEKFYLIINKFNFQFGEYLFAKFLEATIIGVTITIGLSIIGVPFAFLLGLIAGVTNIIPYIGPVLGFVPAFLISFLHSQDGNFLPYVIAIYIVANLIDMFVVFPLLVSKIVNLHPIVVIVSVVAGSQLMGIPGMIISIPIVAFLKLVIYEFYESTYLKS